MVSLPPATVSAMPAITSAISADDGAKRAETGDDFATLLGIRVAVAAGEAKPAPATARPVLAKGGKVLPGEAEPSAQTPDPAASDTGSTDDPAPPTLLDGPTLPVGTVAPVLPPATSPAAQDLDGSRLAVAQPDGEARAQQAPSPAPPTVARLEGAAERPAKPESEGAEKPAPGRPSQAPQFSLPAQAAVRAVLVHGAQAIPSEPPVKLAPVLPEQAAAQATLALAARGNSDRPARSPRPVADQVLSSDAQSVAALPLAPLRPLKTALGERLPSAELQPALVAAATDSDRQTAPQTAAPSPSATPTLARHDFAAMIDRLFDARELAGAQPVALTMRHNDFGAVSLKFRSSDDGLTVTMASGDPDFARAVNAAAAPAGTGNQSELSRQGGEPAWAHRQGTGNSSPDSADRSRAGSREAERDTSRQRRDQPSSQRSTPRQQDRSGIFA